MMLARAWEVGSTIIVSCVGTLRRPSRGLVALSGAMDGCGTRLAPSGNF